MDFYDTLTSYLSNEEIQKLKKVKDDKPTHGLLLNNSKMSKKEILELYPLLKKHPLIDNAFIYDKDVYDLGKSIYHDLGAFYLQEPSSMVAASLLDINDDDVILDMSAAPGGKTIGAKFKNPKCMIFSNDISKERALNMLSNIERLGLKDVIVTNNDFRLIYKDYPHFFDKIILDAPCSGSAMFRKDKKMLLDWSMNKVYKYQEIQKELLEIAYYMLKPGGILLYSTCSFSYEEDEQVIIDFLKNKDMKIKELNSPYFYKSKANIGIHLFPFNFPGEGQYICLMEKKGIRIPSYYKNLTNHYQNILEKEYKNYEIKNFSSFLFMVSRNIKTYSLNIIRYGVKIGEYHHNFIKYDHHYARILSTFKDIVYLNEEESKKYIHGECLSTKSDNKENVLLKFNNLNIGISKINNGQIKNHYPKGLRH